MARMGEERGVYRVLVGKPEGRRPLGRPKRRWVDIRTDLQACNGADLPSYLINGAIFRKDVTEQ